MAYNARLTQMDYKLARWIALPVFVASAFAQQPAAEPVKTVVTVTARPAAFSFAIAVQLRSSPGF